MVACTATLKSVVGLCILLLASEKVWALDDAVVSVDMDFRRQDDHESNFGRKIKESEMSLWRAQRNIVTGCQINDISEHGCFCAPSTFVMLVQYAVT
jgi:hypothetical protein